MHLHGTRRLCLLGLLLVVVVLRSFNVVIVSFDRIEILQGVMTAVTI